MRIVTWNCRGSTFVTDVTEAANNFRVNLALLAPMRPDICVLQEAPNPGLATTEQRFVFWTGMYVCRGIAVVLGRTVFPVAQPLCSTRSSLLVRVGEPHNFNILAIHSVPEGSSSNYVAEVRSVITHHQRAIKSHPTFVVGDFNSSAVFDEKYGVRNHAELVENLETEFGLHSAYHHFHANPPAPEADPTYYHENGNLEKPFHIDYCFVPKTWQISDVQVGSHEQWCKTNHSDHCPMMVEVLVGTAEPSLLVQ